MEHHTIEQRILNIEQCLNNNKSLAVAILSDEAHFHQDVSVNRQNLLNLGSGETHM